MSYKFISVEDMLTEFKNDIFWHVYNKTDEVMVSSPLFGDMESIVILFQEKKDAETAKFIFSKADDAAGRELFVIGERWQVVDQLAHETLGQYKWVAIDHKQAQVMFEPAADILRTREYEESQERSE
jgi:hypothetical protein